MRKFIEQLKIAKKALLSNRGRTILTILGVVIGVFTVIVVLSVGEGFRYFILKQMELFGSDFIQVEVKVPNASQTSVTNAAGQAMGTTITTLKHKDAEEVVRQIDNLDNFYTGVLGQEIASFRGEIKKVYLFGTDPDIVKISQITIADGEFFTQQDLLTSKRVVVLGANVRDALFGIQPPVGQNIKIKNQAFQVIGTMKKQGGSGFFNPDDQIYLPITTLQKQVLGIDYVSFFVAKLKDVGQDQETKQQVIDLLRQRHKITDPNKDDFAATTMEDAQAMIGSIVGAISLLLGAVAALSLIVGGVGIMNIMLVSVRERTREIGLRKAVGATKKNITTQFIVEAIILTLIGGLLGIAVGVAISLLGSFALGQFLGGGDWPLLISPLSLILGFFVSGFTGLIFGLYPARKAAKLSPIEALRF
ncbi:MAG: hypothetical protein COU85_02390 [Candidatus Portnoybacteria bacterium CG10_big_fil_rev_8_21_14_0_10_44_7]|uniref:Multidrug ABC transporter substrate-binding protein n=1 Tax=Candidatus Portnoybacteria bacterium CG10_big_fil_rev_8_21_14_0_10_44_7 TaxID=1974816 RepID=A0A2M8KIC1_9BACT|nr:MAG: hypothetical protein COU85_02390 [Candidatus Portnoybacteria bacterium CG10_big_fil_rev_8_21_14_0_10_44_7]